MKRIICLIMTLTLVLGMLSLGAVSTAAADAASIRVGGKTYTAAVGDYLEYTLSLRYTGKRLAAGQIELPVDFSGLSGSTQEELDKTLASVAPYTAASSVVLRSDGDSTIGVTGYVMNFVNPSGYSFSSSTVTFSLIFGVTKAGSYDLSAKLRYFDDIDGAVVADSSYRITDSRLSYTESLAPAQLETPKLSVATDAGGMRISWEPVPHATVYRVYYKGSNGWTRMADTEDTSYLDADVKDGSRYTYTVRCLSSDKTRFVSDFDHSGKSAVYYAAPVLKLSCGTDAVNISWSKTSGASKYRVYYKNTAGGWTKLTDTASTSCTDANVASGKTYTYTIRSMDASGNHMSWFYSGFPITFLSAPSFSLSNAADGVKISWPKVTGAAKYRLFYYGSRGWTRMADTADTSYLDTDVSSNRTYTYTVRCISADGSTYTSAFRTGKSIKYYAAPILTLSNAADGVKISWNAVSGASKYRLYYKNASGSWTKLADTTATTLTVTNVTSGNTYTYTMRAMDANSNHLSWYYTDGFKIQYIKAPTFSLSNAADGVKISWDKVAGAAKYRVFYYGSKGWTRLADTADTSFVDTDVSSNHSYTYTVRCISEDGTAYTSNFRSGQSIKYYAAPKLTLSSASSGVSVKWSAVSGASKYRLYYKSASGWTKIADVTGTSYTDTSIANGATRTYTMRAMDASGNHLSWFYTDGFTITYTK